MPSSGSPPGRGTSTSTSSSSPPSSRPGWARSTVARRYAAGRARALGLPTRGTTGANRLRRVDRFLAARGVSGLVVDLGYGSSPVTTVELFERLSPGVEVVGLEIAPDRVAAAQGATRPGLSFRQGGFELAGLRPVVVRALNVLRQYDEPAALEAWSLITSRLAPGGVLVEGTCDELGRRGSWVVLSADGPLSLTLAAHLPTLDRPSSLAERLPKALIHHNVPGEPVHALLSALDACWERASTPYGARQRWINACAALDWPQVGPARHGFGELTVPWTSVAPLQ